MATGIPGQTAHSVLVVDDHPIVYEGIVRVLERSEAFALAGYAKDIDDALRHIQDTHPDLLIVGLMLQSGSGFHLIHGILAHCDTLPVVVFSLHTEPVFVRLAFAAGAKGYVLKSDPPETLVEALHAAVNGRAFVSDAFQGCELVTDGNGGGKGATPRNALTDRELEVLDLIGRGYKSHQIAQRMFLSVKTVETHREKIKLKLDLPSATELIQYAIAWVHGYRV